MSFSLGEPPIALCRTTGQPGHQKSTQQRMMVDVCGAAETTLKNDKGGDSEDVWLAMHGGKRVGRGFIGLFNGCTWYIAGGGSVQ